MAEIGKQNTLNIIRQTANGVYLDGEELGEVLLPRKYVPAGAMPGDGVPVFVYRDTEDRLVATTQTPLVQVGEVALLNVISVNQFGAFCAWGLEKDLLVPFSEQKKKMEEGSSWLVYVFLDDKTARIAGSTKLDKFMDSEPPDYQPGQQVQLVIASETDIGFTAIINNAHWGLLYHTQIFQTLERGRKITGYISKVREDGKIDLSLQKPHYRKTDDIAEHIVSVIKRNGGFLAVTDKSDPETIYSIFGISKKAFKMAVGALYKKKSITIEEKGLRLTE